MDQKTLSQFNNLPADILRRLFSFFDRLTLIDITRVNKSLCAIAEQQLSEELLRDYRTQIPDALKEGYLLNAMCDWIESHQQDEGDIFSEEQQKLFFQQFKQAAWGIGSDGSETPSQFMTRVSEIFQKGYELEGYDGDQVVRSEYLQKYLKKVPFQVSFLFHTAHVQRLLNLYDCKIHTPHQVTNSQDQKFLAQFLAYTQDLESFLTALIFFFDVTHQIPSANGSSWRRWEVLKRSYVKHTLRGDGMVALSTHVPRMMSDLLDKWNNPNDAYPPLSSDEVQFFFKKLCPADFITYLNIMGSGLDEAIRNKQPQVITLLSHGDAENDIALIHFYKEKPSEEFLKIVENIPELMLRIKNRLFLKCFLSALFISDNEKTWFVKVFLPHFTLKQLSLLCVNMKKGLLYPKEWENDQRNTLQNQFIEKLVTEPNDQVFIDALFKSSFIEAFKNNKRFFARLTHIQKSKELLDYFYKKSINSYVKRTITKPIMVFLFIESKFLHQLTDQQLIFLANPVAYQLGHSLNSPLLNFVDFLLPLFSTGRITKDLFLEFTKIPGITKFFDDAIRKHNKGFYVNTFDCVQKDLGLAFEIVNYFVVVNEKSFSFLDYLKDVIQKFSFQQRITLLENTVHQENKEYFERFFSFEELRTLWQITTTKIYYSLREAFFVNRLSIEVSAEKFITEVVSCGITNTTSWNRQYPAFSTRLQQPDVYLFVFGKCVSLLATNGVKPLDQTILNWLELLAFLQKFSPIDDETQKHTILKQYTSRQLYTLCLQLRTKADDLTLESLQNLFYPLCFNLFDIADLHAFKETCSPSKLSNTLWPNHFINKAEEKLTEKIKQNPPSVYINGYWRHAITTRQFNIVLLLLLIGVGMLIPGLILNIVILWSVALLPIVVGIGILGIPILTTFISCLKAPNQQNTITLNDQTPLLDPDNAPTQTKREEITSQKIASSKPNPTPYKDVLQPSSTSIPIQSSDQEYLPRQVKSPTISNVSNSLDLVG